MSICCGNIPVDVGVSCLLLFRHLIESLVDSGKMEDAESFAKVTEEFIKTHTPHLYPKLFTLLVKSFFCATYYILYTYLSSRISCGSLHTVSIENFLKVRKTALFEAFFDLIQWVVWELSFLRLWENHLKPQMSI